MQKILASWHTAETMAKTLNTCKVVKRDFVKEGYQPTAKNPSGILATLKDYPLAYWDIPTLNRQIFQKALWNNLLQNQDLLFRMRDCRSFWGEPFHTDSMEVMLPNVSHKVTDFGVSDKNNLVLGEVAITDTPNGNIIYSLMLDGFVGISSRGWGDLIDAGDNVNQIVKDNAYMHVSWDFVGVPAVPVAIKTLASALKKNKVSDNIISYLETFKNKPEEYNVLLSDLKESGKKYFIPNSRKQFVNRIEARKAQLTNNKLYIYSFVENKKEEKELFMAVSSGSIEDTGKLLEAGVSVDIENSHGWTPLFVAVDRANAKMVDYLLSKGADINHRAKDGATILFYSVSDNQIKFTDYALSKGADLNIADDNGVVPVMFAESEKMLKLLIDNSADLNSEDDIGWTPLFYYVNKELSKLVSMVIDQGVDVNKVDADKNTPLYYAVELGNLETVKALVTAGAKTDVETKEGRDLLSVADENEAGEVFDFLAEIIPDKEKVSASVNKKFYNSHGHTMTMNEFIDIEVTDRGNYDERDVRDWVKKYNINPNVDEVIWVTPDKVKAKSYAVGASDADEEDGVLDEKVSDEEITTIDNSEGFVIPESDDGEDGFLFVFKNKIKENFNMLKSAIVLDNGGTTFDRYTIITKDGDVFGASDNPFAPNGFGQYSGNIMEWGFKTIDDYIAKAIEGGSLGNETSVDVLPEAVKKYISQVDETELIANKKKSVKSEDAGQVEGGSPNDFMKLPWGAKIVKKKKKTVKSEIGDDNRYVHTMDLNGKSDADLIKEIMPYELENEGASVLFRDGSQEIVFIKKENKIVRLNQNKKHRSVRIMKNNIKNKKLVEAFRAKFIKNKNIKSAEEKDVNDFQGNFCPYGYGDISEAIDIAVASEFFGGSYIPDALYNMVKEYSEETSIDIIDIDMVALLMENILQQARNEIAELTGYDFEDDVTAKFPIYTVWNYMASSYDGSDEAVAELGNTLNEKGITKEQLSAVTEYFIASLPSPITLGGGSEASEGNVTAAKKGGNSVLNRKILNKTIKSAEDVDAGQVEHKDTVETLEDQEENETDLEDKENRADFTEMVILELEETIEENKEGEEIVERLIKSAEGDDTFDDMFMEDGEDMGDVVEDESDEDEAEEQSEEITVDGNEITLNKEGTLIELNFEDGFLSNQTDDVQVFDEADENTVDLYNIVNGDVEKAVNYILDIEPLESEEVVDLSVEDENEDSSSEIEDEDK